jgi:hypothetical protein
MKTTCMFDDYVADAARVGAKENMRSLRQQLQLYVIQGLQRDGYLSSSNAHKKADLPSTTDSKSALATTHSTGSTI